MLNLDTDKKIWIIPMPVFSDYIVVNSHIISGNLREQIIMTHITEDDEKKLDNNKELILKRNLSEFAVNLGNVLCYGDIDFSEGSDDCNVIDSFSFLNYLGGVGIRIPSDYKYATHECHSPNKRCRYTETWRPSVLCRFVHGSLGKPEKVALFKRSVC